MTVKVSDTRALDESVAAIENEYERTGTADEADKVMKFCAARVDVSSVIPA
jgi:outer membrane protein assembly factor BamD (BamD/ComL family)